MNRISLVLGIVMSFFISSLSIAKDVHDITNTSSKKCGKCHEEIYDEWKGSMHAQSTALKDPIHSMFYKHVVGDPTEEGVLTKKGKYPVCLQCHAPAAAKAGKTKLDTKKAYKEGVNCISCHTLTKFKGTKKKDGSLRLGMKAYEYSKTHLQGPKGTVSVRDHTKKYGADVVNNPGLMKTSDACMGCHDQRNNSNKISLCQTGSEVQMAGGSTTCQSCHMPSVNGRASHAMAGGHSGSMVSKGLVMTVAAKKADGSVDMALTVRNLLPHNFPTGAPFRNFYIKIVGLDKSGAEVWSNTKSHPMVDDKKAMFMYTIGNDKGPSSPPMATKVLGDTRLKPNEERVLNYKIKNDKVTSIIATAYYDLLLAPIKKKFGSKLPKDVLEPKEIARATATL